MVSLFGGTGPFAAVKTVATTVVATLQTRLELLANEIQIEKHQIFRQLTLGLAVVFCLGIGVLTLVALLVFVLWDQRLLVLGVSSALFLGLALYFLLAMQRSNADAGPVLAATLAELQRDLIHLQQATGHETEPR